MFKKLSTISSQGQSTEKFDPIAYILFGQNDDSKLALTYSFLKEQQLKYKPIFFESSKSGFFTKVENDFNCVMAFEKLIMNYCFVITYLFKNDHFKKAYEIYLLMITENQDSLDFIMTKMKKNICRIDRKTNIGAFYPKMINSYLKILSCLIKVSERFSRADFILTLTKNYLCIIHLVYQHQIKLTENFKKREERKKLLQFFLSVPLIITAYYHIWRYSQLNIPIAFLEKVKEIYEPRLERDLSSFEILFLTETYYNLGILKYVNGEDDEAIQNIKKGRDIFLFDKVLPTESEKNRSERYNSVFAEELIISPRKNMFEGAPMVSKTPRTSAVVNHPETAILKNIELILGEIHLDKRNYSIAYDHVKNALDLLPLSLGNFVGVRGPKQQRFIEAFLKEIERLYEEMNSPPNKGRIYRSDTFGNLKNSIGTMTKKSIEEMEKFFMFLSSLSIYQIKILNEFQPPNIGNRNYLPILFPNQFKDCLTFSQRMNLDSLKGMALLRYMILKDPNKEIYMGNINFELLNLREKTIFSKQVSRKDSKLPIPITDTPEYQQFKRILNSPYITKEVSDYVQGHSNLVLKILKKSTRQEIKDIAENPHFLVQTIEQYLQGIEEEKDDLYNGQSNSESSDNEKDDDDKILEDFVIPQESLAASESEDND